jgi:hypothetical protein
LVLCHVHCRSGFVHLAVMISQKIKGAGENARARSASAFARLSLFLLLFFSSFCFATTYPYPSGYSPCSSSSDVATWSCADGSSGSFSYCVSSDLANNPGWAYDYSNCGGSTCAIFGTYNGGSPVDLGNATLSSCSAPPPSSSPSNGSCSPAVGEAVDPSMSTSGSFCDPNTDCVTTGQQFEYRGNFFNTFVTNGQSCSPTASTVSPSSGAPCPSGYSPLSNGCECVSSSGNSYVSSSTAASNSACNGGSSSTPVLTPSAPVSSSTSGAYSVPGTSAYCPAGSGYLVSSSGQVECLGQSYVPSGSNSSFKVVPATQQSNGSYSCPPGASSVGSGSSMQCIEPSGSGSVSAPYGSGSSPTASGSSGTSPTGSAASQSYPSSLSVPGLPSVGVRSIPLSSIPSVSSSGSSVSCPSPLTFNVFSHNFQVSFRDICTVAGYVRPVVIGVFSLSSLFLLAR